jgi:hypothetical protein
MPKMISVFGNDESKRPWNLSEKDKKVRLERIANNQEQRLGTIYITAQLSNNQYSSVINGEAELEMPDGTSMFNRKGSKILEFTCQDETVAEELIDGLENSGISWQENYSEDNVPLSDILENQF